MISFRGKHLYQRLSVRNILSLQYTLNDLVLCLTTIPGGSDGKASAYNVGDLGSIPGSGRSPGEGNGNLLQYSCLENPMDRRGWSAAVDGATKNWTLLSD